MRLFAKDINRLNPCWYNAPSTELYKRKVRGILEFGNLAEEYQTSVQKTKFMVKWIIQEERWFHDYKYLKLHLTSSKLLTWLIIIIMSSKVSYWIRSYLYNCLELCYKRMLGFYARLRVIFFKEINLEKSFLWQSLLHHMQMIWTRSNWERSRVLVKKKTVNIYGGSVLISANSSYIDSTFCHLHLITPVPAKI